MGSSPSGQHQHSVTVVPAPWLNGLSDTGPVSVSPLAQAAWGLPLKAKAYLTTKPWCQVRALWSHELRLTEMILAELLFIVIAQGPRTGKWFWNGCNLRNGLLCFSPGFPYSAFRVNPGFTGPEVYLYNLRKRTQKFELLRPKVVCASEGPKASASSALK